jgi:hypothetical protein
MQLDLLLRSSKKHWPSCKDIAVLWKADDEYIRSYAKLPCICHGDVFFYGEHFFKEDLLFLIDNSKGDYILLNSDDNVFINDILNVPFNLFSPEIAFSLRLGEGMNRCEPAKKEMIEPEYFAKENHTNVWDWTKGDPGVCYYYPQPFDSNIYEKEWLLKLIKDADFKNPYELEIFMNNHRDKSKHMMVSFKESKLISLMVNTTGQNTNPNMAGAGQSLEELNKLWLDGYRIKADQLYGMKPKQCHIPWIFEFEKDDR